MEILIKRIAKRNTYTIGKLYINGEYLCDTLEDTDRGLTQDMPLEEIKSKKVYSQTAIPTGTYQVTTNVISPKFKNRTWAKPYGGKIPRLLNVPGFDGILIHVGTSNQDTSGCVLVGYNKVVGKLVNSTTAFNKLMQKLNAENNIIITIK